MELEFDKEMDALLRKAAGRGVLVGDDANLHLDADTIAAFAENALPQKSRTIYTQHLAACDPCRMSLANMIRSSEAEPALAAAAAPVPAVSVPWYRRLFLAPNLAYVMGGLVVVFGGLFGFLILQNSRNTNTAMVSQIADTQPTQSAPAYAEATNSLYSANTTANSAANISGEIPRSVGVADQPMAESNVSTTSAPPPPPATSTDTVTSGATAQNKPNDLLDKDKVAAAQPMAKETLKREEDEKARNEPKLATAEQEARKQDADQANIFRSNQQNQMSPGAGSKTLSPNRNDVQRDNRAAEKRQSDDLPLNNRTLSRAAGTSADGFTSSKRSVGGKTFELKQGAWYDSSYSGQKTKNVRRSSDDYRKLDGGLRSIADTLGGTVVVVWNSKAYRIQ